MPAAETSAAVSAVAACISSFGTLAAAAIAVRAVRLSGATTRQNNEVAARDRHPTLSVTMPPPADGQQLLDPASMVVNIENTGTVYRARHIRVVLTRLDGLAQPPSSIGTIDLLGPGETGALWTTDIPSPYGLVPVEPYNASPVLRVELVYEEESGLLGWRKNVGTVRAENGLRGDGQFRVEDFFNAETHPAVEFRPGVDDVRLGYWPNLGRAVLAFGKAIVGKGLRPAP